MLLCIPWVTQGVVAGLAVLLRLVVGWLLSVGLASSSRELVGISVGSGGRVVNLSGGGRIILSKGRVGRGVGGEVWLV